MTRRPGRKPAKASAGPRDQAPRHPSSAWLFSLASILLATFAVYVPSLRNDFTNWDDPLFVLKNPLLVHPSASAVLTTPVAGNYHPLTIWSLVLNYRLSGFDPISYHWLNLLLHLANTALVFVFVRRLTANAFWTTIVTSLFFGIHPMHVESVAWIAERKDVLYTFFYLAGLIAYVRYLDQRRAVWLGVTFLAFVLSVASKPSAVVFPLTLLAIDFYRRRPFRGPALLEKAPFLVVSVIAGLLTIHAQNSSGALAPHATGTVFQKVLFASYGTMMYVVKLIAPFHLSTIYPYPDASRPLPAIYDVAFVVMVVALPAIVYFCRRNRAVLFGLAFFFINILLVLQLFPVGGAVMADRYTYLPYVGLFFAISCVLDVRSAHGSAGRSARLFLGAALALLVPISLVGTWSRCAIWRNSETLWTDIIRQYPTEVPDAYGNRGWYYFEKERRTDVALADLNRSLALNPKQGKTWLNKGAVFSSIGQDDSALVCFDRALQIEPDLYAAWSDRGGIRARKGDLTGAVEDLSRAIAINPQDREAYSNRALAYLILKDYDLSIADSRRVIELDPNHRDNYLQLAAIGMAQQQSGRNREAVGSFNDAIRLSPPGAQVANFYLDRSRARWALEDKAGAASDLRDALRLGASVDPTYIAQVAPDVGGH